jgi:positive regulator of sigma E activity
MIVFSLALFSLFLILPLADMISLPLAFTLERLVSGTKTGYSLIELFSDPRLFRTYSTTEPVKISQLGGATLVNFIG